LAVIHEAGLSDYFLVTQDIVSYTKGLGHFVGPGRGSAGGCLLSYLLNITTIDPLQYGLIFERFFNKGRSSGNKVKLPDIDLDVEVASRPKVIDYIRSTYGDTCVSNITTFGKLMGRGAIKEVLRALDVCDFNVMNLLTQDFPKSDSEVAGELQDMRDVGEKPSIIMWMLKTKPKNIKEWCHLDKNGDLQGEYSEAFKHAIRLEGIYKSYGKHASGLIISDKPIYNYAPMVHDKSNPDSLMCGFEMHCAEDVGLVKYDLLNISLLDKMHGVINLVEKNEL